VMNRFLALGRRLIDCVLSLWHRVSVPAHQTWGFQQQQWVQKLSPQLVVDVGANTGQWAKAFRESFPNQGHLMSFEPDSRAWEGYQKNLQNYQGELIRLAAGSKVGTSKFFKWSVEGGSSSLMPLTNQGELFTNQNQVDLEETQTQIIRLDKFLLDKLEVFPDRGVYVKIDVQGGELEVLDGLEGIVSSIDAIEIEIPLLMVYEGGSSILQILNKLETWGFTLISAQTERWNSSKMLAADFDALFVKTEYIVTTSVGDLNQP